MTYDLNTNRIYSGCDVHIPGNDAHGVSAERAAVLAAVSAGVAKFEVSKVYYYM